MALNGGTNDAGVKRNVQNVYAGSSAGAWQHGGVSKEEMRMMMRQENESVMRQFSHLADKDYAVQQVQAGLRAERGFLVEVAYEGSKRSYEENKALLRDLDITLTRVCDYVCNSMGVDLTDKRTTEPARKRVISEVTNHINRAGDAHWG